MKELLIIAKDFDHNNNSIPKPLDDITNVVDSKVLEVNLVETVDIE